MRLIIVFSFICVSIISCHEKEPKQIVEILKLENVLDKKINLSDLEISSLIYPDSVLFATISDIKIYQEGIFLLDNRISKSILQFDLNGNYIAHFSRFGGGTEEYQAINDFYVENSEIFIAEREYKKIKVYDLKNFNLKREIDYHSFVTLIERINENAKVVLSDSYDEKPFEFIEAWNSDYTKKLFSHKTDFPLVIEANYHYMFKNFNDTLYYAEPFTDVFYQITDKKMRPVFKIDFEKYQLSEKFMKMEDVQAWEEELFSKEYKFNLHHIAKNKKAFSFLYYHTPFYKNLLVLFDEEVYEYPQFYRQLNFEEIQQSSTFKNMYYIIAYGNEMPSELLTLVKSKAEKKQNLFYLIKFNPFKQ